MTLTLMGISPFINRAVMSTDLILISPSELSTTNLIAQLLNYSLVMAEDEGFEPSVGCPTHAFQACALGRYANPPVLLTRLKGIGGDD